MSLLVYSPAYAEPVSLVEMKNHLRVETSMTDDDGLISSLTTAARDMVETGTGWGTVRNKVILSTTFDLLLNSFYQSRNSFGGPEIIYQTPNQAWQAGGIRGSMNNMSLQLPRCPLTSVTSITYLDMNGVNQVVDPTMYAFDIQAGRINLNYQQYWPYVRYQANAVDVRFTAGMAATFTADPTTDTMTVYGRTYANDDRIQVMNSGGNLPGGLASLTTYWVVSASGSTFKLALTSGGSAIDITSTGVGDQFASLDMKEFETARSAIKLLVGFWYDNRAGVETGRQASSATVLPYAIDAMIATIHA